MSSEALVDSKIAGQGQTAPSSRSAAYEAYLRALRWRACTDSISSRTSMATSFARL